jgi:hypothetical protein
MKFSRAFSFIHELGHGWIEFRKSVLRFMRYAVPEDAQLAPSENRSTKECGWKDGEKTQRDSSGQTQALGMIFVEFSSLQRLLGRTILRGGSTLGLANPARQSAAKNQALL